MPWKFSQANILVVHMMHLPAFFACSPLLGYVAAVRSIESPNHQGLRAQKGIVKCDELSFFNVPRFAAIDIAVIYTYILRIHHRQLRNAY
jgi:hypothetical protein